MTPDELRQKIEMQVVELIKEKMSQGTMTQAQAQQISQLVLTTLKPGMSFEELYRAIPKLDDTVPELSVIVLPIVREYEESIAQGALPGVRELIKQGQYDAASKLATRAINQEVKLQWEGSGKAES